MIEIEALRVVDRYSQADALVHVPRVLFHDPDNHVIIMSDCGQGAVHLKQLLLDGSVSMSPHVGTTIGNALGQFLARIHSITDPEQLAVFKDNAEGKRVSALATYGRLEARLTSALVDPSIQYHLQTIRDAARLRSDEIRGASEHFTMGDFWPGNVLINIDPATDDVKSVYVVDWELAKTGLQGLDIGQFAAEMSLLQRFSPSKETAALVLSSFLTSYKRAAMNASIDLAKVAAMHTGAHWVAWGPVTKWGTKEELKGVVQEGVNYLQSGMTGSNEWLSGTIVQELLD